MAAFNRRSFLDKLGNLSAATVLASLAQPAWSRDLHKALFHAEDRHPAELAGDEDFWYYVQQSFTVSPELINLNNGGVSPSPKIVQDAMKRYHDMCNEAPSYYMWRILDQGREPLRKNLAEIAGCSPVVLSEKLLDVGGEGYTESKAAHESETRLCLRHRHGQRGGQGCDGPGTVPFYKI